MAKYIAKKTRCLSLGSVDFKIIKDKEYDTKNEFQSKYIKKFPNFFKNVELEYNKEDIDNDNSLNDNKPEDLDEDIVGFIKADNKEEYLNGLKHYQKLKQIANYYDIEYSGKEQTIEKLLEVEV